MTAGPAAIPGAPFRPEWEFLKSCARNHPGRPDADRVQALLGDPLACSKLMAAATHHGVTPLLFHHLSSLPPGILPDTFLDPLRAHACLNAEINHRHARELVRILDLFHRHGIEALPFKGVALAASVYGSLSLRKAGDLDILLRPEEAIGAKDLLLRNGYLCCGQGAAVVLSAPFGPFEFVLRRADGGVGVDLRWKNTPPLFPNFDLDLVRHHSQPAMLDGYPVVAPAPEENLILLCIHGSKHEWSRLLWICDVAELIRTNPGLDWQRVRSHAAEFRLWRAVKLGLLVAREVLQSALPPDIAEEIAADSLIQRLGTRVVRYLSGEIAAANRCGAIFDPQLLNGFPQRLRCRVHRLPRLLRLTPRDREIVPLPESLSCLHYVLRPVRLGIEYAILPLIEAIRGGRNQR